MTKAPERIWATTGAYYTYVQDWSEGEWDAAENFGVEYIRADHALALVAAAYEDAAQHHDYHADGYKRSPEDKAAHQEHAKRIRARTNDDAQAALERVKQEANNEALREAAEAVYRSDLKHDAYDEILSLITEDQSDE